MPRPPPRYRVAPTRRAEPTSAPAIAHAQTTTAPPHSDSTDVYGVSDRELERQKNAKKGIDADIPAMTDAPTAIRSTRSRSTISNAQNAKALEYSRKRRDAAMSRLEDITSTTAADMTSVDEDSLAVETGRKTQVTTLQSQRRTALEASGMEIMDDEIFGHLDSTLNDDSHDEETDRAHRSADTSAFSMSGFKRRPRQSSIVSRDDAPIRPSSRGPTTPGISSTFNLGHFTRRARQPSILLSSAQKERLQLLQPNSEACDNAVDDEDGDEEDVDEEAFLPEAEGTPARTSRARVSAAIERDGSPQVLTKTRSRKRKSTESHETKAAKRQAAESDDDVVHESIEVDDRSSPHSFLASSRNRTPEVVDDDDILAPPASSSASEGSPTVWPSLKALGKAHTRRPVVKRTPALDDDLSDISSPPSLTHSPNFPAPKTVAKSKAKAPSRKQSPQVSTADLEALLPRRRNKTRRHNTDDPFAIDDSNDEELPARPAWRKQPQAQPLRGASTAKQSNTLGKETTSEKRARRTYGSRHFSDKENTVEGDSIEVGSDEVDPTDDTAFEDTEMDGEKTVEELGAELKSAAKKFEEVDKWELAFEEMTESSSPVQDGR